MCLLRYHADISNSPNAFEHLFNENGLDRWISYSRKLAEVLRKVVEFL